ncbi:MAG: hypothetical protein WKF84_27760 [Pyrinomonadaceae bacterium]
MRIYGMRDKAIAEYHEALATDACLDAAFFARLRSAMTAMRMLHGDRQIGVALRPHLLTNAQYDAIANASETLAGALERVVAALLSDPSRMEMIGLTDAERRLALISPGYSHAAMVTARLDAFIVDQEVKFVECNAENPSSLPDQLGLNQILFEVSALQKLCTRYRLRQFDPVAAMLRALLDTYREWCSHSNAPQVAIVDWSDLPTEHEFHLLRNHFVGCGVPTIICTPDDLEYSNGQLRVGNFRVDLIYKRVIIHEFLARYDESHPLVQAYINHDVCLVNSFRCKLPHKKAVFELLTDETNENWFSPAEQSVIRRSVPWTRRVRRE